MCLCNSESDRQTEARALTDALGGKERLEYPSGKLGGDSRPTVVHVEHHVRIDQPGAKHELAADIGGAHGLLGIENQVENDLLNLFAVHPHRR